MVRHPDKVKLLFGPYRPPPLQRGRRVTCLYRDCDVVITSWSDGRISWPRCRALDSPGGGSGLLVDEELARAIRSESAAAVMYWWGVNGATVWLWRKALGVEGRYTTEGTKRLRRAVSEKIADALRGKPLSPEQVEQRRENAVRLNLGRFPRAAALACACPEEQVRLLGTAPDEEVARRIGRSMNAVRVKRTRRGIPDPGGRGWTAEEMALLGTAPDEEVAAKIGRTSGAVTQKRCQLGIATFRDRRFREGRA
jgi:hypothetical protein